MVTAGADIVEDFVGIHELACRPVHSAAELEGTLRQVYQALFSADLGRYDPAMVKADATRAMLQLFETRMALRDRIRDWQRAGLLTRECMTALRDCLRSSRYAADMIGELAIDFARLSPANPTLTAFTGADLNTLIHPRWHTGQAIPFQRGDVLLVRGLIHNSAAIARIGDTDSQFSHVSIVDVDEAGQPWGVEALMERGAVVSPLRQVLEHGLGRAVLLRPRDAALGERAARLIRERVAAANERGRPIRYDFSMMMASYKRLFCTKLVRLAYDLASDGKVLLPTFATQFNENRDFYRRIGVKAVHSFTPGDMEVEPHFDIIAEWQDYRVTGRLRLQDLLMTKLFEWMEQRGWHFEEDNTVWLISIFGRLSAQLWDRVQDMLEPVLPRIPPNMRRRAIAAVAMLHSTAEPILARLEALERDTISRTGRPLHPREVLAELERIREASGGRIGYLRGPA